MVFTVIGLVVAAVLVGTRIHSDRANDRRSDEVYCTLSGVGPYDRAPNTGKLCIDLH